MADGLIREVLVVVAKPGRVRSRKFHDFERERVLDFAGLVRISGGALCIGLFKVFCLGICNGKGMGLGGCFG